MITNPRFACVYVSDQDKALEFWSKTIGFDVQLDAPYDESSGARWIEVKPPAGETYIVIAPPNPDERARMGGFSNIWFECDDLDKTYEDLSDKGVEFPVPPADAPWSPGARYAQFSDPDGNTYGLSQRA
jgi:uncharacterized glyoxalase superfamily protein PhnB